jgi:RNA polymerase I-specific transcription initiation factor RRN3
VIESIFDSVHDMIQSILSIIPSGPGFILPLLSGYFPHRRMPLIDVQTYIRNLLRIITYVPVLKEKILHLIVENLIQIDVCISLKVYSCINCMC